MLPSFLLTPERMASPLGSSSKLSRPFLHPTISRLRSYTPQASRMPSSGSVGTLQSHTFDGISPSPSHFSDISRSSSPFNGNGNSNTHGSKNGNTDDFSREVFRWTQLRNIGHQIYAKSSLKASTILGSIGLGSPMVMAANGLICIGTDSGRIFVFDFKQNLKCICGSESSSTLIYPILFIVCSRI